MKNDLNNSARNTLMGLIITLLLASFGVGGTAFVQAVNAENKMKQRQEESDNQQTKIMIDVEIVKNDICYIKDNISDIKNQQSTALEEIKKLIKEKD